MLAFTGAYYLGLLYVVSRALFFEKSANASSSAALWTAFALVLIVLLLLSVLYAFREREPLPSVGGD